MSNKAEPGAKRRPTKEREARRGRDPGAIAQRGALARFTNGAFFGIFDCMTNELIVTFSGIIVWGMARFLKSSHPNSPTLI